MTDQSHRTESDTESQRLTVRPIPSHESDIAGRIASLIRSDESQNAFARRCGIGETTLRKYLAGAEPSAGRLVAIADAGDVSIEWLAAGRGSRRRTAGAAPNSPLSDRERLAVAVRAVEAGLASIGKTMPPEKKAELICAAYDLLSQGNQSAQIIQFIKLAA